MCEELIADERVSVNGEVAVLGRRVDTMVDVIAVDGVPIGARPDFVYYLLNKPAGVVTTASDTHGRLTVVEVVPAEPREYPVGRLDLDTEGLLLLTNDGELAEMLTHPRYHVVKRYAAKVAPRPTLEAVEALREGVRIGRARTAPAYVREERHAGGKAWFDVRIAEGRNQQVRRMFESVGCQVEKLRREAVGPLVLGALEPGEARALSPAEVGTLREAAEAARLGGAPVWPVRSARPRAAARRRNDAARPRRRS